MKSMEPLTILLVEDEADDVLLFRRALEKTGVQYPLQVVTDGEAALAYLAGSGKYADRTKYPRPGAIILDLKMPRLDGLQVLASIKNNPDLRVIPTLILSSSKVPDDIARAYELGANSYFAKPSVPGDLHALVQVVNDYWKRCLKPGSKPD